MNEEENRTEIDKLLNEDISAVDGCSHCKEAGLAVGTETDYGSVIVMKIGHGKDAWFATLSPRTGSDPDKDFTVQLMPVAHLTHFSQINEYPELARNYGIAFSRINAVMTRIMGDAGQLGDNPAFKSTTQERKDSISIATYGKSTTWKDKKEHIHIKIFPFRGVIGQPYTVDSSFGRKQVFRGNETNEEYVKMTPVVKKQIPKERLKLLSETLIAMLGD